MSVYFTVGMANVRQSLFSLLLRSKIRDVKIWGGRFLVGVKGCCPGEGRALTIPRAFILRCDIPLQILKMNAKCLKTKILVVTPEPLYFAGSFAASAISTINCRHVIDPAGASPRRYEEAEPDRSRGRSDRVYRQV